jgi:FkbM family methyltransferase
MTAMARAVKTEARAAARHLFTWAGRPIAHALPSGLSVRIANASEWHVYNEVFVDGEYDQPIRLAIDRAIADLATGDPWMLDLGAHAGFFTLRFADLWYRARAGHAFHGLSVEGSPSTARHLAVNLSQVGLNHTCKMVHGLVGARSGQARISRSFRTSMNSIMSRGRLASATVPFVDLTAHVPADARVALLKCDIEGAEQLFLETYPHLLERVDLAVFELHDHLCDVSRCRALLSSYGLTDQTLLRRFSETCTIELFATRRATLAGQADRGPR